MLMPIILQVGQNIFIIIICYKKYEGLNCIIGDTDFNFQWY